MRTLNEGRGINPGDTVTSAHALLRRDCAQRRPGHQPRRHRLALLRLRDGLQRSTKAGASTPATLVCPGVVIPPPHPAQRRPGHQPRRHPLTCTRRWSGLRTAQRRPGHQPRRHIQAATTTPRGGAPLNEGRGINPGDTTASVTDVGVVTSAQRRPGHQPRRHWSVQLLNPGARPAQRRPGHQPRRHSAAWQGCT